MLLSKTESFLLLLLVILLAGCDQDSTPGLFQLRSAESTGFSFTNNIVENDSINAYTFLYAYNGSGVGIGDLNNDGLQDIVMGGNMVESKIFINQGEMQFSALESSSGFTSDRWVHGVTLEDVNQDGLLDIYLSNGGVLPSEQSANQLFLNQGNLKFKEVAAQYNLDVKDLSTHTVFFDFDNDNDLDAYVLNYENNPNKDPNIIKPKSFKGNSVSQDRLLRNDDGVFTDVSLEAGINREGYGLGIHATDFNNDGWLDLYVSNDFAYDDLLYINQRDGTFRESLTDFVEHTSNFGMGIDVADVNNDGHSDIYQVDMLPEDNRRQKKLLSGMNYDRHQMLISRGYIPQYMRNSLQLNNGREKFQELGYVAGVSSTDWSWSPLIADLDNDGWKDLYITNGYVKDVTDVDFRDYIVSESRRRNITFDQSVVIQALEDLKGERVSNYAYSNRNGVQFQNATQEWNLEYPTFSTGSAYGDLDNDGDLDLVVNNLNDPSFLLENLSDGSSQYFQLKINSNPGKSLLGTKVKIFTNGQLQMAEWNAFRGFQSTSERIFHFGLGSNIKIDSLIIEWPDAQSSVLYDLTAGQRMTVNQEDLPSEKSPLNQQANTKHFADLTKELGFDFTHEESGFVDFKSEALIPHKLSTEGPVAILGDVNNDGLEDVFIGNSAGQKSVLMIQSSNIEGPSFIKKEIVFGESSEVVDAAFFDFDNDNDLDIYVVNGSNEFQQGTKEYKDLLLLNDGRGNFRNGSSLLPNVNASGGAVAPYDFDNDGDIDLFIGGALAPGNYPKPGTSQFLVNESGVFKNKIKELAPELEELGMIKAAAWEDLDNDGLHELIITGEFMPIVVFRNNGLSLKKDSSIAGLNQYVGWWNDMVIFDADADGDLDILAANLGLNSRYQASLTEPLNVYAKDFDNNGTLDAILTYFNDGKEYPIPDRALITQQIPPVKKKFTSNIKYAEASIDQVFPKSVLESAYKLSATHFETSLFENKGNGKFEMKALPLQVQYSRVNSLLVWDMDGDGLEDVIMGGNSKATEVFTGNYDAQASLILKNLGGLNFDAIPTFGTGFPEDGVITDLHLLNLGNEFSVLSLKNNEAAQLSRLTEVDLSSLSGR